MKILVTGAAGFIGFHTVRNLVGQGHNIFAIDNINDYYEVSLKSSRLKELGLTDKESESNIFPNLRFLPIDIVNENQIKTLFETEEFDAVIHLAAQAGVRYSITNPLSYIKSNAEGFLNILEGCRHQKVGHLIYASSSSVYGENAKVPFSVEDPVDHPVSLYAATKRSKELMAHAYSHLYQIPTTGLRFFTVYGPWGRPDMAPFLFAKAIFNNDPIKIFNNGNMQRDFTYVEDIVTAQNKLLKLPPSTEQDRKKPNHSTAPFRVYNIGNSSPVNLMDFVETLEKYIGKKAKKVMMPMQAGDVPRTYADVEDLFEKIKYRPTTNLDSGIKQFIDWFRVYYKL